MEEFGACDDIDCDAQPGPRADDSKVWGWRCGVVSAQLMLCVEAKEGGIRKRSR